MFKQPLSPFLIVVFTAIGVAVCWGKLGRTKLKAYVLSDIVSLLPISKRSQHIAEFCIFVILGCLVGIGVSSPTNASQAIAAGVAWTSFFSTHRERPKSPKPTRR